MKTIKAGVLLRGLVRARLLAAGVPHIEGKSLLFSEFHIAEKDFERAAKLFPDTLCV